MIATGFRVPLLSLSDNYDLLSSDDAAVATERLDLAVNLLMGLLELLRELLFALCIIFVYFVFRL